jgi:DNA helicase II / ATP-dependent DNA helicase PcrA
VKLSEFQDLILQGVDARFKACTLDLKGMLIEALAGTGKSFILVQICQLLSDKNIDPEEVCLVVFGRKNKADLQSKLGMQCGSEWVNSVCTLNSLGFQILKEATGVDNRQWKVENLKYSKIAREYGYISYCEFRRGERQKFAGSLFRELEDADSLDREFEKLLEKFRLYCLPVSAENLSILVGENLEFVAALRNRSVEENVLQALSICLKEGYEKALSRYWIDFTDQAWILVAGMKGLYRSQSLKEDNFAPTFQKWSHGLKFVAVDEAQDTDILQIELLSKLVDPSRNFLCAVGDRRQAVYSFRGCVSDGLDKFKEVFACESFLLPINYRCGKSHLRLVREIFPDIPIEPAPNAIEGQVKVLKWAEFPNLFADLALSYIGVCRRNAPLITTALQLLGMGLPVKIKDSSLAKKIVAEVEKICKKLKCSYVDNYKSFPFLVTQYEQVERERLFAYEDSEQRLQALNDMLAAILALYEAYEPQTLAEWESSINRIFDESKGKAINLYSIHSGKGGEADVAFVINAENMPLIHKKQTAIEREQEDNLLYVALTRGQTTLALISDEPTKIGWLPQKYLKQEEEQMTTIEESNQPSSPEPLEDLENPMPDENGKEDTEYFCPGCNVWISRNAITERLHSDYQLQLCKVCNSEVFHQFDIRAPQIDIEISPKVLQESKLGIPEEDLFALIAKIENLPRSQQRTIVRELIDRLGQESIASLLD